jgi:ABC-type uncharacterized transport system ATPase subunit
LEGVTKRFPGVVANDDVSLELRTGEIHALVGENGAGKSTLMRVLYGIYPADGGRILVHGNELKLSSPRVAIANGIGMVHQHFVLVDPFTVTENIILGDEGGRRLDLAAANERISALAESFGFSVDPSATVGISPSVKNSASRSRGPVPGVEMRPRRADGRAHTAGNPRALRQPPPIARVRQDHRVHQSQAR